MGGMPPVGYELKDQKLVVKSEQAEVVRHIFGRYAKFRSLTDQGTHSGPISHQGFYQRCVLRADVRTRRQDRPGCGYTGAAPPTSSVTANRIRDLTARANARNPNVLPAVV